MIRSFWQIGRNWLDLITRIEESEGDITGELEEALAINKNDLEEKIQEQLAIKEALQHEVARLKLDIAKSQVKVGKTEELIDKIKANVVDAVNKYAGGKLETGNYRISIKKTQALKVYDKSLISRSYMRFTLVGHVSLEAKKKIEASLPKSALTFKEEPNLIEIKKAIEAGESVGSGYELIDNESLVVR